MEKVNIFFLNTLVSKFTRRYLNETHTLILILILIAANINENELSMFNYVVL
jgi:general stress protein CsbA